MEINKLKDFTTKLRRFKQRGVESGISEPMVMLINWKHFKKENKIKINLPEEIVTYWESEILFYGWEGMARPWREVLDEEWESNEHENEDY